MLTSPVGEEDFDFLYLGFLDDSSYQKIKRFFSCSFLQTHPDIKDNILSNLFFYSCGVEKDILCNIVAAEMGAEPEDIFWEILDLRDSGSLLIEEDIVTGVFDGQQ